MHNNDIIKNKSIVSLKNIQHKCRNKKRHSEEQMNSSKQAGKRKLKRKPKENSNAGIEQ